LTYLREQLSFQIEYVGVDISYNLLAIANKKHPDARWIHADISVWGQKIPQESFDVVVGVASFHHLPTRDKRSTTLAALYAGLCYGGSIIMTNRCYSDWFRGKFANEIRRARLIS
jgi:trans-aconitate methyltransferase